MSLGLLHVLLTLLLSASVEDAAVPAHVLTGVGFICCCAMMRNIVGTRAEAPVAEQNHNCSPSKSERLQGTGSMFRELCMFQVYLQ